MTSRIAIYCLASFAPAVGAAQTAAVPGAGRLSLEEAIRIAVENNRQLQSARLQVDKAETDVETARTRRLPAFDLEVTTSQLLTPVSDRLRALPDARGDRRRVGAPVVRHLRARRAQRWTTRGLGR